MLESIEQVYQNDAINIKYPMFKQVKVPWELKVVRIAWE